MVPQPSLPFSKTVDQRTRSMLVAASRHGISRRSFAALTIFVVVFGVASFTFAFTSLALFFTPCANAMGESECALRPSALCAHDYATRAGCAMWCGLCKLPGADDSGASIHDNQMGSQQQLVDIMRTATQGEVDRGVYGQGVQEGGCSNILSDADCQQRPKEYCELDESTKKNCPKHCGMCGVTNQVEQALGNTGLECVNLLGDEDCSVRPEEYCEGDNDTIEGCRKHCGLCGNKNSAIKSAKQKSNFRQKVDVEKLCIAPPPPSSGLPTGFYDVNELYPEVVALSKYAYIIAEELRNIPKTRWRSTGNQYGAWEQIEVFGFEHWITNLDDVIHNTMYILKEAVEAYDSHIVGIVISKIYTGVNIPPHFGWAELSNHVLRAQIPLVLPRHAKCRIWVEGNTQEHSKGSVILFDDSLYHSGCCVKGNEEEGKVEEPEERVVLIVDVERLEGKVPMGTSTLGTNKLFQGIKDYFLSEGKEE